LVGHNEAQRFVYDFVVAGGWWATARAGAIFQRARAA